MLSHDGRGHGAGVFVDKVVVKEKDTEKTHLQYVFPCGRWLDTHEDDCVTERTLRMIGTVCTCTSRPVCFKKYLGYLVCKYHLENVNHFFKLTF